MSTALSTYNHRSVQRVTTILGRLGRARQPLRLSEISRFLGVDTGTTYRMLSTLVREGFVYKDPATRRYALGYEIFQLGASGPARETTAERAHQFLAKIAIETASTVVLASRQGREVFLHKKIPGPFDARIPFDFGKRRYVDAHATAVGKVLLAFSPPTDVVALYADESIRLHTPKTLQSFDALNEELARVRQTGFATEKGELVQGLCGVGVPMYNPDGVVNLAVWLQCPPDHFSDLNSTHVAAKVQSALSEFIWFATRRGPRLSQSGRRLLAAKVAEQAVNSARKDS